MKTTNHFMALYDFLKIVYETSMIEHACQWMLSRNSSKCNEKKYVMQSQIEKQKGIRKLNGSWEARKIPCVWEKTEA